MTAAEVQDPTPAGPATPVTSAAGAGWFPDLVQRARPFWPIGVIVTVVVALIGLVFAWQAPRVYRTEATVYPPSHVATMAAGQRYALDMAAAVNSAAVRNDVARELGLPPSSFDGQILVKRIGQSDLMQVALSTSQRLPQAGEALSRLVARAGASLAGPDVSSAKAQLDRTTSEVATAEAGAVKAKKARDAFLAGRQGVTPDLELAILGPQLAQLRLCASGAIVPPGASRPACARQLASLEARATALGQASDQLAALNRDGDDAERSVEQAQNDHDAAQSAVTAAGVPPIVEMSQTTHQVSRLTTVLRRVVAVLAGAVFLGFAVVVALALLARPRAGRPADEGGVAL